MNLIELIEKDKPEYNRFVALQPSGSFLQSWEWGEWQKNLGREAHRFFLTNNPSRLGEVMSGAEADKESITDNDEQGETIGSIQLTKMPLPMGRYYLYAPYGPVLTGGDLRQETRDHLQELVNALKLKFPDAIFVRLEPKIELIGQSENSASAEAIASKQYVRKTKNIQPGKTLLLDLQKTEEQLLSEMHHKTRYNIKLAKKHGVEIQEEFAVSVGHGLFYKEAIELIMHTAKRQHFTTYPQTYYEQLVDFFALKKQMDLKLHIYKAVFQNQLLAAAVMLDFAGTRTFLFGGSSEFHKNVMAPYLLHWLAITDAKKNNLKIYDFWGIETARGETPGFVRFKLGFGGLPLQYGGAFDVAFAAGWYKIYSLARFANKLVSR